MPRDPLDAVLRVRRMAVDTARRHLAERLTVEEAARKHAEAAETRILSEGQAAADIAAGDGAVEAFAAWLPVGRAEVQAARAAHDQAMTDVNMARAAVNGGPGRGRSSRRPATPPRRGPRVARRTARAECVGRGGLPHGYGGGGALR